MAPIVDFDAALFDYSGVMTTNLAVPDDDGLFDSDALYAEMAGAMMNEVDHPWHALERGEISLQVFIDDVESRVPGAATLFEVDSPRNVMANLELRHDRIELVERLRDRGLRVGLVTNNVAEWEPLWRPGLPAGLFEIVIDSAVVGCRKPEPRIYELALDQLEVSAARTLFIDDFEWNVAGAEAVGLCGVHCGPDADLAAAVERALNR